MPAAEQDFGFPLFLDKEVEEVVVIVMDENKEAEE